MYASKCEDGSKLSHAISRLNRPDVSTLAHLLRQCISAKSLEQGRIVHDRILREGFAHNTLLQNLLIQMYGRCGHLDDALEIFKAMNDRNIYSWNILLTVFAGDAGELLRAKFVFDCIPAKDEVSWNILISANARSGHYIKALTLLAFMDLDGVRPNQFTFLSALEACGSIRQGKLIHELVIQSGMELLLVVGTAIVTMYGKLGSVELAKMVFDKMPHKNNITWNAMLAVYAQAGQLSLAKIFFDQLPRKDVYSWTTMVAAFGQYGRVDEAREFFDSMPQRNVVSWNAMVAAYATNGRLNEARSVFDRAAVKNTASWNAMISGYAQHGDDEAIHLFRLMDLSSDPAPNRITFISALNACACCSRADLILVGEAIHEHLAATSKGSALDVVVATSIVNMYGKCGALDRARRFFDSMPVRSFVSWNAMLAAYAQHGQGELALEIFHLMNLDGTAGDDVTVTSVLAACSHLGAVSRGRSYFVDAFQSFGMVPNCDHYLCMIDLLGRAGQGEAAASLVRSMPFEPNSVALTMALGSGVNGGNDVAAESTVEGQDDPAPYLVLSNIQVVSR